MCVKIIEAQQVRLCTSYKNTKVTEMPLHGLIRCAKLNT